jgi:iron(II)-dependent oxidoreductase
MVPIPGGTFIMGSDDPHGYDNEKRVHRVEVAPFALDAWPVSVAYWREFIADGGYSRRDLWSPAGWEWRKEYDVCRPEYWLQLGDTTLYCSAGGPRALHTDEPASAISWFEADAYARWAGKRLPTEAEWEFAAAFDPSLGRTRRYPWGDACDVEGVDCEVRSWHPSLLDAEAPPSAFGVRGMAGGVWEWTASPFLPYPGFEPFPYDGYSKEHMDGLHLVCRGGSWATDRRILRSSFRNWYVPGYRQGFLGMRCAR